MKTKISVFAVIFILLTLNVEADDRKSQADKLREIVWAWDNPEFKNYEVPLGYENESAVILVRHQHIEATGKNRFRMNALLIGDINRELYYTSIDRRMVKINSPAALEAFAELSFTEESKLAGYLRSNKMRTIVGARVIKPDGNIIEVDIDDEAVAVTEGRKEKEVMKKVAIPGLQVGDILDYFVCDEMELETYNAPPELFAFFGTYPVLKYSVHCEFGDKLTVEYRSINGAPEMIQSVDEDNNYVLDVRAENLMKIQPIDETRWISPYRSLPMIRMYVLNNGSKLILKSPNARKNGVYEALPYEEYQNDLKTLLAAQAKQMLWMKEINKKVEQTITRYMEKNPSLDKEALAALIYDALRFHWPGDYNNYPPLKFIVRLQELLKEYGVPHKLVFTTNRFDVRKEDVTSADDIYTAVLANNDQLFFFRNGYRYAGEVPAIYHGECASTIEVVKYDKKKKYGIEGEEGEYRIPESRAEDNLSESRIEVRFTEENPLQLKIKRNLKCTGSLKEDYWNLLLYEDWDKEMRERLGVEQTLLEELKADKSSRKQIDQYLSALENRKKEQRDHVEMELTLLQEQKPDEVYDYSFESTGATVNSPALLYRVDYSVSGLVKNAGDNLILDVGRLIGGQWEPTELDERRNIDAYLPSAMSLNYVIVIEIPEGYVAEQLDELVFDYSNDYGAFRSEYKLEGSKLIVSASKIYAKGEIPVDDWDKLLQIARKTNEFQSKSIVLKRL